MFRFFSHKGGIIARDFKNPHKSAVFIQRPQSESVSEISAVHFAAAKRNRISWQATLTFCRRHCYSNALQMGGSFDILLHVYRNSPCEKSYLGKLDARLLCVLKRFLKNFQCGARALFSSYFCFLCKLLMWRRSRMKTSRPTFVNIFSCVCSRAFRRAFQYRRAFECELFSCLYNYVGADCCIGMKFCLFVSGKDRWEIDFKFFNRKIQ